MIAVMGSVGWLAYEIADHEADEIFDAQLAELAQTLLVIPVTTSNAELRPPELNAHKYQGHIAYQLWQGNVLVLRSNNAPIARFAVSPGYSEGLHKNEKWYFFATEDKLTGKFVITGQAAAARHELQLAYAWQAVLPIGLGIVAFAILTWLLVSYSFRPVNAIMQEVESRSADNLSPVAPAIAVPRELSPLLRALNHLLQRVGTSFENERRFSADAAHELRTPLSAMRLQAQLAREANDESVRRAALDTLQIDVDRATHLVEQLLALARADAFAAAGNRVLADVEHHAVAVVAQLVPEALSRQQHLELEVIGTCVTCADAGLIRLLIHNLVGNAIKYCPDGARISVRLFTGAIEVADNGPGIALAAREIVMRRFVRLHKGEEFGSGLGLSIVERVAQTFGGHVSLMDTPGGGLTVRVELK
jgi:two-component system sensor histidine kinase QseC